MSDQNLVLNLNKVHAKCAFLSLIMIEFCIVTFYVMNHIFLLFGKPHEIIDLDGELTFPSWFSSIQLFCVGFLLLIRHYKIPQPKRFSQLFLSLVAIGFIFLSLDEAVSFHEKLSFQFISIEWLPRFKNNNGLWIPVYLLLVVSFMLVFRNSIMDLWQYYRKQLTIFAAGLIAFLLGGVVLEIIGYEYLHVDELKTWYLLEVAIEEGLEMFGASLMLYATMLFVLQ